MKTQPKYSKGQRLMYKDADMVLDDNMVVDGDAEWYPYAYHPNKGYWQYPIVGKANMCPEDHLSPYIHK